MKTKEDIRQKDCIPFLGFDFVQFVVLIKIKLQFNTDMIWPRILSSHFDWRWSNYQTNCMWPNVSIIYLKFLDSIDNYLKICRIILPSICTMWLFELEEYDLLIFQFKFGFACNKCKHCIEIYTIVWYINTT